MSGRPGLVLPGDQCPAQEKRGMELARWQRVGLSTINEAQFRSEGSEFLLQPLCCLPFLTYKNGNDTDRPLKLLQKLTNLHWVNSTSGGLCYVLYTHQLVWSSWELYEEGIFSSPLMSEEIEALRERVSWPTQGFWKVTEMTRCHLGCDLLGPCIWALGPVPTQPINADCYF